MTHRLGQGGFGEVFLGFRPDVTGPAAVKIFKAERAADSIWHRRFLLEIEFIRTMAGVHTAALLDAGGNGDPPWLATRYVQAPSLYMLVRDFGVFEPMHAWWLATGLGEALAEIHAKGILHRDLKPQNILVATSGVQIIDFGISRFVDGSGLTTHAQFFGSLDFAPTEQLLDVRQVTEKSDVFALGAVLMWVTTGRTPYQDVPWQDRMQGVPPDLDAVPLELHELVEDCLAINPEHRPTAAQVFTRALNRLADYAVPLASDTGLPLPVEIRDFVDDWAATSLPVPDLAVAPSAIGAGSAPERSPASGAVAGMATGSGPGDEAAQPLKPLFGTGWRSQWRDGVERRRGTYGG